MSINTLFLSIFLTYNPRIIHIIVQSITGSTYTLENSSIHCPA